MTIVRQLRNRYFFALDIVLLDHRRRLELRAAPGYLLLQSIRLRFPLLHRGRHRCDSAVVLSVWHLFPLLDLCFRGGIVVVERRDDAGCGHQWRHRPGGGLDHSRYDAAALHSFHLLAAGAAGDGRAAFRGAAVCAIRAPPPGASAYVATNRPQRVLVVGAGNAGTIVVREMLNNPSLGMEVIGFVDDDPRKRSARIAGVPVLGNRRAIPQLVTDYDYRSGDHRHSHGARPRGARHRHDLRTGECADQDDAGPVRNAGRHGQRQSTAQRAD